MKKGDLKSFSFPGYPEHEACWAITCGPEGNIYAALCGEKKSGLAVQLFCFYPHKNKMEHLVDFGKITGQDPKNGRPPQCKIHFSLCADNDGVVYAATHCSSPAAGQTYFGAYETFGEPRTGFPGSYLVSYRPGKKQAVNHGIIAPYEGMRIMTIDRRRKWLYGITYPRSHFIRYCISTGECIDAGRITENNPYGLVCDEETGDVYTVNDEGYILRYDFRRRELEQLWARVPHPAWRFWSLESVQVMCMAPGGNEIFGITNTSSHIFSFHLRKKQVRDMGIVWGKDDPGKLHGPYAAAITFGHDGKLYCAAGIPDAAETGRAFDNDKCCHLIVFDPETGRREELGAVRAGKMAVRYIPRMTTGKDGNIYMGEGDNPGYPPHLIVFYPAAGKNK